MLSRIAAVSGRNLWMGSARVPVASVIVAKRFKAWGDNNEPYVPTDAYWKEYNYDQQLIWQPPQVPTLETVVVNSVQETLNDEPLEDSFRTRFGQHMPTINDDKDPRRDTVNYPRMKPDLYAEACRIIVFPDSWFRYFYDKTGVTGPYVLVWGTTAFLFSKELLLWDHEVVVGISLFSIFYIFLKLYGAKVHRYFRGQLQTEDYLWEKWRGECIATLEKVIEHEKSLPQLIKDKSYVFQARRENIQLQREAEYRRRLMQVYQEVKRKLDFQIAVQNEQKSFAQKHMVKWILEAVNKGIAQTSEKEALAKCISDLKALSQTRANVI